MRPPAAVCALLLAAVLLGGCGHTPGSGQDGTGSSSTTSSAGDAGFDGEAALAFVEGLALGEDGEPRFRIPGTTGQREGAAYLWEQTDLPGWGRAWQNFTGADYLTLDRSVVQGYTVPGDHDKPAPDSPPGYGRGCTQAEHDAVAGLPFHNLFAVRRGTLGADAPLVLLGAHWDSQMHSDYDPDPAKRDLPDPGANDGASGVGLLLQLMRELDAEQPDLPFSVGLFFIDGEDGFFDCYPLAGSLYFAQHQFGTNVSAFILLDMVGDPGAKYPKESYSRESAPDLVELVWRHGQELDGGAHFIDRSTRIQDDHVSLALAGIPSIDIIDAGRAGTFPPQWDTSFDTVDRLDPAMLALVGDVLLASLEDPVMAEYVGA